MSEFDRRLILSMILGLILMFSVFAWWNTVDIRNTVACPSEVPE